ncbi:MAG: LysR family transcriptional regulator [Rhodospirillaceae bacterium]
MITFKQMEALFWIAELGSFAAAANKLNTTQSAVSKRIQELETGFGIAIFDRSRRTARLTEKGEELLLLARDLLERRDRVVERVSAKEVLARRFRLGVTELTALTWLPALIDEIRAHYPRLIVEPEVELSSVLFERLAEDSIDLIVTPDVFHDARCVVTPLTSVENAWMCTPALAAATLGPRPPRRMPLAGLSAFTVLTQGNLSGTGVVYGRWFRQNGMPTVHSLSSNNLVAQLGLTLSGLGITYLPVHTLRPLLRRNLLQIVETDPPLPDIPYAALYRAEHASTLCADIAAFAAKRCDFTSPLMSVGT